MKGGELKGENGDLSNRKASPFNERIGSLKGVEKPIGIYVSKKSNQQLPLIKGDRNGLEMCIV